MNMWLSSLIIVLFQDKFELQQNFKTLIQRLDSLTYINVYVAKYLFDFYSICIQY